MQIVAQWLRAGAIYFNTYVFAVSTKIQLYTFFNKFLCLKKVQKNTRFHVYHLNQQHKNRLLQSKQNSVITSPLLLLDIDPEKGESDVHLDYHRALLWYQ